MSIPSNVAIFGLSSSSGAFSDSSDDDERNDNSSVPTLDDASEISEQLETGENTSTGLFETIQWNSDEEEADVNTHSHQSTSVQSVQQFRNVEGHENEKIKVGVRLPNSRLQSHKIFLSCSVVL